ncbi:sec-independent protein translocase protein TatC [Desulfitobacterium sp. LBE]|nr:sec-independent protein translocase protein TatC [Desulfitobacterium sp. LBE]
MRRRQRNDDNMPLTDHLRDLRKVLVVAAYAIAGGTVLGWFVSDLTFAYLARPVSLLGDITFITTTPMEPMLVKIKVSVIFGVALALPVLMWKIWSFVLPALKQNERKYLYFIVPTSVLLFIGRGRFLFICNNTYRD